MILTLELLKPDELTRIREIIEKLSFEDGAKTASMGAKQVKSNLQADAKSEGALEIEAIIKKAVSESPLLQQAFLPLKIRQPIISQYKEGMSYGWHTDSPLMDEPAIRTDVAMTVFINDPQEYMGGELVLVSPNGNIPVKLPAGQCVVYPTTMVHCVSQITSGVRSAIVTWMQSKIRSQEQRDIVFNLSQVMAVINQSNPNSQEANMLMQSYSNLVRMWAEV